MYGAITVNICFIVQDSITTIEPEDNNMKGCEVQPAGDSTVHATILRDALYNLQPLSVLVRECSASLSNVAAPETEILCPSAAAKDTCVASDSGESNSDPLSRSNIPQFDLSVCVYVPFYLFFNLH